MSCRLLQLSWLFSLLLGLTPTLAAPPALIPAPRQLCWTTEAFALRGRIQVSTTAETTTALADSIVAFVRQQGAQAERTPANNEPSSSVIQLALEPAGQFHQQPEGYSLTVSKRGIQLTAATEQGLFWGYRTLQQLLQTRPTLSFAGCRITDYPAFPIRGLLHDTGRSFIPLDTLYRHLAVLSRYKLNTFHWHLTEDLAWRLALDSLPQLTAASSMLRDPGKFYSKAQVRELLAFCRARHIQVIPEIDMPGHSAAFKRAIGFDMQSEQGKKTVKQVLREVCALFEGPYVHLGSDEVTIRDPSFLPAMAAVVQASGKQVLGWYPGGTLDSTTIRQLWMSSKPPLPSMRIIESRNLYLNHFATQADLISLFQRNLGDVPAATPRHLGAIAAIWNDRRPSNTGQLELLNGLYPALLTLAERAWRGGGQPETQAGVVLTNPAAFEEFEQRLLTHKRRYFSAQLFPYVRQSHQQWRILAPFPNNGDLTASFPPEQGKLDFPGVAATGATVYLRHTWGPGVVRAYVENAQPNHTAYAYTAVYSPKRQQVGLWANFHNYGRSEKDASPPAGAWDYKGSRLWLNGVLVPPPSWQQAGLLPTGLEQPYRDEPYEAREPTPVWLNKGWNQVLIKLPVGAFSTPEYRLVKWMFTCALVRQQAGQWEAADELIFAPEHYSPLPLVP
ncbi:beta-N-acetylhexosaminidase (plasmid) [Hymenobacter tibetensis]|uniref:beta-N-acetylhexosaminidase n=1 Tax=Hymenobacter tibetensis TaxID=497967 RepID=A0ABY4D8C5_9BACT|nr:family 20 glycosylhydrolase [Hymenobacter tibetensis]UOG77444.1 beta-N-acetylhexosaminidase [Hymenobacter tibetensis]